MWRVYIKEFIALLIIINLLLIFLILLGNPPEVHYSGWKSALTSLDYPVFFLIFLTICHLKATDRLGLIKETLARNKFLVIILCLAFLLRFVGIFYPEHHGIVEQEIYTLPIQAAYSGEWLETFKKFSSFETLGLFIQGAIFKLTTYFNFKPFINVFHFLFPDKYYFLNLPSPQIDSWPLWSADGSYNGLSQYEIDRYALNYFIIRLISVFFGTLTVYLTYLIARLLFGESVALFSSLCLGITFIHVVMSMIGRQYVIATFFATLTFLSCWYVMSKGRLRDYLFFGIAMGLTNATKVFPALAIPFITAWVFDFLYNKKKDELYKKRFYTKSSYALAAGTICVFVFVIGCPYTFVDPELFYYRLVNVINCLTDPAGWGLNYFSAEIGPPNWVWWTDFMSSSGLSLPLYLSTFLGMTICIYRAIVHFKREDVLLLSVNFTYFYMLATAVTRREEFIVFITPFLAIFSGIFIVALIELIGRAAFHSDRPRKVILASSLFFIIGIPFFKILLFDYSINTADNRTKAAEWIDDNIPADSHILLIGPYTFKTIISDKHLIDKESGLKNDFHYYLSAGVDYFVVPAVRDLGQFIYHPYIYPEIQSNLKLLHNADKQAEFYRPFFKNRFFSPIITAGNIINEQFDQPLEIYKTNGYALFTAPPMLCDPDFILEPPENVAMFLNGFELVGDQTSDYGKSFQSAKKGAKLWLMPKVSKGEYVLKFRVKVTDNSNPEPVVQVRLGSNWEGKDYGSFCIKGSDIKHSGEFHDVVCSLHLPQSACLSLDITTLTETPVYVESIFIKRFPELLYDPYLLLHPPDQGPRCSDGFELLDDKKSPYGISYRSRVKGAEICIMPRASKGEYQLIFRARAKDNLDTRAIMRIQTGSIFKGADYGTFYIKGTDFKSPDKSQDISYNVRVPQDSRLSINLTTLSKVEIHLESIRIKAIPWGKDFLLEGASHPDRLYYFDTKSDLEMTDVTYNTVALSRYTNAVVTEDALWAKKGEVVGVGGPYQDFPPGKYRVEYRLKTGYYPHDMMDILATIRVQKSGGAIIFNWRELKRTDFSTLEDFENFGLTFELKEKTTLEFFTSFTGMTDMWLQKIHVNSLKSDNFSE